MKETKRTFEKVFAALGLLIGIEGHALAAGSSTAQPPSRPNIVVFTVDDMDYSTMNSNGCPVPGLTPNMDRLASQGILLEQAHVPNAVCQPSRQSMMTGLHPHRNGSFGFCPVPAGVPNLSELLIEHGWDTASFNKGRDYASFKWSEFVGGYGTRGFGRDPGLFAESAKKAIIRAKGEGKPFFLNIATTDPHRPFPGGAQEKAELERASKTYPEVLAKGNVFLAPFRNICTPAQAWVPPYLPSLPKISEEWSQYYNAVHRADETLGRIMEVLKQEGVESNTIVFFYSDNGASFPTSKQNCYPYSTRTPLIVRWPGMIKPGLRDSRHLVSTMDIMPTLLEVTGIPLPTKLDGRSLLPLLKEESQPKRDHIFITQNYIQPGIQVFPMRAVHTLEYSYVFSAWANGKTRFGGECHEGMTFNALKEAATSDPAIASRVDHIVYREREELYDLKKDPWCLKNLVADPSMASVREKMRGLLQQEMRETEDPLLPTFMGTGQIPEDWLKHSADSGNPDETRKQTKKNDQ